MKHVQVDVAHLAELETLAEGLARRGVGNVALDFGCEEDVAAGEGVRAEVGGEARADLVLVAVPFCRVDAGSVC